MTDKPVNGAGCRSPPANLKFIWKIQIGGKGNVIQLWQRRKEMAALERSRGKTVTELGVNEDTIERLHTHDWAVFNSNRRYYRRLQEAGTYFEEYAEEIKQSEVKTVEECCPLQFLRLWDCSFRFSL